MENSTPILVGAGQFTERDVAPSDALPPMGITAEAAKTALSDTGIGATLARKIDTIAVVRIFPDSSGRSWLSHPFGRAQNPPRAVARRIGANPTNAIYSHVGGNGATDRTQQIYRCRDGQGPAQAMVCPNHAAAGRAHNGGDKVQR